MNDKNPLHRDMSKLVDRTAFIPRYAHAEEQLQRVVATETITQQQLLASVPGA